MRCVLPLLPALAVCLAAGLAGPAAAQPALPGLPEAPAGTEPAEASGTDPDAAPETAEALRRAREETSARLEALRSALLEDGAPADGSAAEIEILEGLESAYARHLAALDDAARIEKAGAALESWRAGGTPEELGPPPYSLAVVDAVQGSRRQQALRARELEERVGELETLLQQAEARLEEADPERRRLREKVEAATGEADAAALRADLERARLASRAAAAERGAVQQELRNARAELELARRTETALAETVAWARERIDPSPESLRAPLAELERREVELTRLEERTRREAEEAERQLRRAERSAEGQAEPSPALLARIEALRTRERRLQHTLAETRERLARAPALRELWERRLQALAGKAEGEQIEAWAAGLREELEEASRAARLARARRAELERDLAAARRELESAAPDGPARRWQRETAEELEAFVAAYDGALEESRQRRELLARSLADLEHEAGGDALAELRVVGRELGELWDVELFAVDDRSITVGKVVRAIVLLGVGLLVASLLTRWLGRALGRRLDAGAASAIQGLSFYLLAALVFLFVLRTVNIPLTAFAVLGGALAIGVGFGSQNVVNNFISGLILMAERPIKLGDLVEVAGVKGHVERIGPRSTRIRTFDNIHLIVPNASFLEQNVVNWTLSNDDVRSSVSVGVAYGSPTREVDRLLRKVMTEHELILDTPPPVVQFAEFGDNALLFNARFWVRSRDMGERLRIESEVRFQIDDLFREAGITIAFPQRDVHLDAEAPIAVRLLRDGDEA